MSTDENETMPPRPAALNALTPVRMSHSKRESLWSRVEASAEGSIAAANGPVEGPPKPAVESAGTSARAAMSSSLVKVTVVALAAGGGIGATVDHFLFPPAPRVVERVVVRTEQVVVTRPGPPVDSTTAPTPRKAVTPKPVAKPQQIEAEPPPITAPHLNVERQLIEAARTALVRRDSQFALQTLEKLRRDFPSGQMAEERESLQVQALQQARRDDEARAAAKAFVEKYPRSVFGPAVEGAINAGQE